MKVPGAKISKIFSILVVAGLLFLTAGCGGGDDGDDGGGFVCSPNGNIFLSEDMAETIPLTSIDFVGQRGVDWPSQSVYVGYVTPPVAFIAAGYPPGVPDPATSAGVDLLGPWSTGNPFEFSIDVVDNTKAVGTYSTVFRFVVADSSSNVVGCQDLPVTYTITP